MPQSIARPTTGRRRSRSKERGREAGCGISMWIPRPARGESRFFAPKSGYLARMFAAVTTALPASHQGYLLQARQMQALSFAVHIPLVCFGIAFPAMVLFAEWLYARSGDE